MHFNSQPHEEADKSCVSGIPDRHNFNSQPHEEADAGGVTLYTGYAHFNSQPHEEADHEHLSFYKNYNISTHSLTKRLTNRVTSFLFGEEYFNSQPHEEADPFKIPGAICVSYFNSQPHEEADVQTHTYSQDRSISTHSLTKRLTGYTQENGHDSSHFNSQPHEEADDTLFFTLFIVFFISTHSLTKRLTYHSSNDL